MVKLPTIAPETRVNSIAVKKLFVDKRKKAKEMLPNENTLSVEMSGYFRCLNNK
jgi:hypothetical protein